jgi:hypothetical protein
MKDLPHIREAIAIYHDGHRHPKHDKLMLSGLYALAADAPAPPGEELAGKWPEVWPNTASPGVYLIFDGGLNLLYVGKAQNQLGYRLSAHFQGGKTAPACRIVEQWSQRPAYVATVPFPESSWFEALALEGYLIEKLDPPDNKIGKPS